MPRAARPYPLSVRSIRIRDPFIVPRPERGDYVMFGTNMLEEVAGATPGFNCYTSTDLVTWQGPTAVFRANPGFWGTRDFWAPEVHQWRGRWYMLASVIAPGRHRGTHAFVAEQIEGPYTPVAKDPLTPLDWECLDGTLFIEDGKPWLVFCHEWVQIGDGTVCAVPLADDLSHAIGEPVTLFTAGQAAWVDQCSLTPQGPHGKVTDGPWLHRLPGGQLVMMWSTSGKGHQYCMSLARSAGGVLGPWTHDPEPFLSDDGGHGMIFRTLADEWRVSLHRPNRGGRERAHFQPITITDAGLSISPD